MCTKSPANVSPSLLSVSIMTPLLVPSFLRVAQVSDHFWHLLSRSMKGPASVAFGGVSDLELFLVIQCVQKFGSDCLALVIFEVFGVKLVFEVKFSAKKTIFHVDSSASFIGQF